MYRLQSVATSLLLLSSSHLNYLHCISPLLKILQWLCIRLRMKMKGLPVALQAVMILPSTTTVTLFPTTFSLSPFTSPHSFLTKHAAAIPHRAWAISALPLPGKLSHQEAIGFLLSLPLSISLKVFFSVRPFLTTLSITLTLSPNSPCLFALCNFSLFITTQHTRYLSYLSSLVFASPH